MWADGGQKLVVFDMQSPIVAAGVPDKEGEPYRMYNLDVFEYLPESNFGLYGSIPVVLAHKPGLTVGAFWCAVKTSCALCDLDRTLHALMRHQVEVFCALDIGPHADCHTTPVLMLGCGCAPPPRCNNA